MEKAVPALPTWEVYLRSGVFGIHIEGNDKYQNNNKLFMIETRKEDISWYVGYFENSFYHNCAMIGWAKRFYAKKSFHPLFSLNLVYGYDKDQRLFAYKEENKFDPDGGDDIYYEYDNPFHFGQTKLGFIPYFGFEWDFKNWNLLLATTGYHSILTIGVKADFLFGFSL